RLKSWTHRDLFAAPSSMTGRSIELFCECFRRLAGQAALARSVPGDFRRNRFLEPKESLVASSTIVKQGRASLRVKNTNGNMPAYQRIQATIRKRIDAGELHPGDAVESERELARIHQVSLMTARHALASLEREGVVERRRGIGTFVTTPKIHFNKL